MIINLDHQLIVLYHAVPNNLLYDTTSQCITALIDYNFTCILHPSYKFLHSFDGTGGQF